MTGKELKEIVNKLPDDYEVTYGHNIGHIILQPNQISVFDNTKEIFLQTQRKI